MAALTQLTLDMFDGPQWKAFYKSIGGSSSFKKRRKSLSVTPGPTSRYGIDTLYLSQFSVAASGTATIDVRSYTDAAGQAAQLMARVKAIFLWLHDSEDDTAIVNEPASGISLGPAASNGALICWADASDRIKLLPGEQFSWWTPRASGYATSASLKDLTLTNLDSSYTASGRILIAGSLT